MTKAVEPASAEPIIGTPIKRKGRAINDPPLPYALLGQQGQKGLVGIAILVIIGAAVALVAVVQAVTVAVVVIAAALIIVAVAVAGLAVDSDLQPLDAPLDAIGLLRI